MIMRVSARLFLCGIGGLLVMSSFSFVAHGNVHSEVDKSDDEASSYGNAPAMNKEHIQDSCQAAQFSECFDKVNILQQKPEEHSQQQLTCIPVFKRFLTKLLREIEKLGLPTAETAEKHYDAEVKLSKQMVSEIQKLVNDESSWRTGVLDDALSQILVNFKLHDYEAWKWRFEDTFGVELGTVIDVSKVLVIALIIAVIICTARLPMVSSFVTFRSMFAVFFIISLVWNWFYLYKMACAENQAKMVKWEKMMDKCTRGTKNDWLDNLKEWYRTTWTLQDDPCKEYFEVQIVYPILRVPPMKVITMTLTTLITDPVKDLGQGISVFLRVLLKDLPITLQIPVLILLVLSSLVVLYSVGQAAVRWPLRGRRQDPPPGTADQPDAPPNRLHIEQQRLYEETQQNDTLEEAAVQDLDQHVEAEPQKLSNGPEEEIEASAHNTEMKHTLKTSNEASANSGIEDNKKSGNTERNDK